VTEGGATLADRLDYFGWRPSFVFRLRLNDAYAARNAPLVGAGYRTEEMSPADTPLTGGTRAKSPNPQWVPDLAETFSSLLSLAANWNGYGAPAISTDVARAALGLAFQINVSPDLAPTIIPTQDGGIQFEWHTGGVDLEVELLPNGAVDLWYEDAVAGAERDERLFALHDAARELNALLAIVESRTT
jgi:hypothetical protein